VLERALFSAASDKSKNYEVGKPSSYYEVTMAKGILREQFTISSIQKKHIESLVCGLTELRYVFEWTHTINLIV
jgi:hypothetical protein